MSKEITKEEFLKLSDIDKVKYAIQESLEEHKKYNSQYWKGSAFALNNILQCIEQIKKLNIHDVMPRESDFKKALELLRDLAEIQNGSPMHKDAEEWQDIMSNIWDFLTTHEA